MEMNKDSEINLSCVQMVCCVLSCTMHVWQVKVVHQRRRRMQCMWNMHQRGWTGSHEKITLCKRCLSTVLSTTMK